MITEKGKYYIIYKDKNLILDLGFQEEVNFLGTKEDVFITDDEKKYNDFLATLNKEDEFTDRDI